MRRIASSLFAAARVAGVVVSMIPASGQRGKESSRFSSKISTGYRDWQFISVAHNEATSTTFA